MLQKSIAHDVLDWAQRLSGICTKTGVPDWELLLMALIDWIAKATEPERSQRVESLKLLVEKLKPLAESFEQFQASQKPKEADEARAQIDKILKEFSLEKFPVKDSVQKRR